MARPYVIEFPDYVDTYAGEIEAKGYCADLVITTADTRLRPVIYDPTRLAQTCSDALSGDTACFAAPALIVVAAVMRHHIEAAVKRLATGNFAELLECYWRARLPRADRLDFAALRR